VKIKEAFKDKANFLAAVIAFFGAYLLIPAHFDKDVASLPLIKNLWASLDPSWTIGLNYVKQKGLTWGTDVAFTYGPLAQFCTRVGWGESRLTFLLFDLFVFVNYFLLFFIAFKHSSNRILTTLLILTVCLLFPINAGGAIALILMAFLVFLIRKSLDNPKPWHYFFQVVTVALLFYIKFNTALIAMPLFFAGIVCNLLSKNANRFYLAAYSILPIVLIITLAAPLNVALLPYIKSGFEIVSGYNDVMYTPNLFKNTYSYFLAITAILTIVLALNRFTTRDKNHIKTATVFFIFGTSIFVLYKQAFIRADHFHVRDFFIYIPLIILCNPDLHSWFKFKITQVLVIGALYFPFHFLFVEGYGNLEIGGKFSKSEYIQKCIDFPPTNGLFLFQDGHSQLPATVKQKIGNHTVDTFPWNIQLLLENKLNYAPRPVFQSYTVYTPYLEKLNFDHYNSSKAPEFVIYDYASIDNRYPLFDEPKVNLALFNNYKVAEVFDFDSRKVLLLQKKVDFKPIEFVKINEYTTDIDRPLLPKEGIYYEIGIQHSLGGKITSVLKYSPEIDLIIKITKGEKVSHRTSKLILENGIFGGNYINSTADFMQCFEKHDSKLPIKYYKFAPLQPSQFEDKIQITEYKIKPTY
jgi:hypothetical protein